VSGSIPVAIVTERTARMIWPGEDALGRCFVHENEPEGPCREIVGIVEDTRYRQVLGEPSVMYYLPIAQVPGYAMRYLLVRPRGDTDAAIAAIRGALRSIEPGLPHVQARVLSERVDPQLQPWRLGAVLFSAFGTLALMLAGIGLFGVVAYDVAQRTRELGVRTALGARAASLVRLVMTDALRIVIVGTIIGLAAAAWTAPRIEPLLYGVTPRDPPVLVAVAAILLAIGALAAAIPAWRAARIQPTEALREE
jgi:putative ABC transport system permease protein